MTGSKVTALATMSLLFMSRAFAAEGNVAFGQRIFGACAACHSGGTWSLRLGSAVKALPPATAV